ncbi:MAG: dethiobiotin synthase [Flavobacteriales bacterium]|nr:dethiobiotin synthase [Flavobacteriales bacterium]
MRNIFVTGIATDAGKSVVAAILVQALGADYWKPVQAGDLHNSDTIKVKRLVSNETAVFYPETYRLSQPMSPHAAAAIDGVEISTNKIAQELEALKPEPKNLVIEGAGGLMVPLNSEELIVDLIAKLGVEVVVVLKNYLGSINHSLMTLELLKQRGINVLGVIFNGETNTESEKYILEYSGVKCLGRIPYAIELSSEFIREQSHQFVRSIR